MTHANHDKPSDAALDPALSKHAITPVQITLNAVLTALDGEDPKVLCTSNQGEMALPYGPFDPLRHRTFEIGLREWVTQQTQVTLGYVEQLYTFGDRGREPSSLGVAEGGTDQQAAFTQNHRPDETGDHLVSVGYLALAPEPAKVGVANAQWRSWYQFFPWEDWRNGQPTILKDQILPCLHIWCAQAHTERERAIRAQRVKIAFGLEDIGWEEERTLERLEIMYESSLVQEAPGFKASAFASDIEPGLPMTADHRRILATAIGRLRGKLKYRPVIFQIMPREFTLLTLQKTVEAIIGFPMHKQNFRRSIEGADMVVKTGTMSHQSAGRPAALFSFNQEILKDRAAAGLVIPRLKR